MNSFAATIPILIVVLSAIAAMLPSSPDELSAITGFGPISAARHFGSIRAALDATP